MKSPNELPLGYRLMCPWETFQAGDKFLSNELYTTVSEHAVPGLADPKLYTRIKYFITRRPYNFEFHHTDTMLEKFLRREPTCTT